MGELNVTAPMNTSNTAMITESREKADTKGREVHVPKDNAGLIVLCVLFYLFIFILKAMAVSQAPP